MKIIPAIFEDREIRRIYDEKSETWFFSVVDIIQVLTQQPEYQAARNYWKVLKNRLAKEGSQTVTNCNQLKLPADDGKMRLTDVANAETLLRLVQSVPSPKAEPIKLWLAKVGYERMQEMTDPALSLERARATWQQHGRSDKWIQQRMTGQETRNKLTDYWAEHDVKKGEEYDAPIIRIGFPIRRFRYNAVFTGISLSAPQGRVGHRFPDAAGNSRPPRPHRGNPVRKAQARRLAMRRLRAKPRGISGSSGQTRGRVAANGSLRLAQSDIFLLTLLLSTHASCWLHLNWKPHPCGFYGDSKRECRCSTRQIENYRQRISGPLLDRIDLHVEVPLVGTGSGQPQDPARSGSHGGLTCHL